MNKKVIKKIFGKKSRFLKVVPVVSDMGITNKISDDNGSVFLCDVGFDDGSQFRFVCKRKYGRVVRRGIKILADGDRMLLTRLMVYHKIFGFNKSWMRESVLYKNFDSGLKKHTIGFFGSWEQRHKTSSFIALEEMKQLKEPSKEDIYKIIDVVVEMHIRYYNDESVVKKLCLNEYSLADYKKSAKGLKCLFNNLNHENEQIFGKEKIGIINEFLDNIHLEYKKTAFHKTLTHNDFAERNISVDGECVVIFDWEIACYQNPEHDLVELLTSLMEDMTADEIKAVLDYYRAKLGVETDDETYHTILMFNLLELCVNKLTLLRYMCRKIQSDYARKIAENVSAFLDILKEY